MRARIVYLDGGRGRRSPAIAAEFSRVWDQTGVPITVDRPDGRAAPGWVSGGIGWLDGVLDPP